MKKNYQKIPILVTSLIILFTIYFGIMVVLFGARFYTEKNLLQQLENARTIGYVQHMIAQSIDEGELRESDADAYSAALKKYEENPTLDNLSELSKVTSDVFSHIYLNEEDL